MLSLYPLKFYARPLVSHPAGSVNNEDIGDGLGFHTSNTLTHAATAVEGDNLAVTFDDLQDRS